MKKKLFFFKLVVLFFYFFLINNAILLAQSLDSFFFEEPDYIEFISVPKSQKTINNQEESSSKNQFDSEEEQILENSSNETFTLVNDNTDNEKKIESSTLEISPQENIIFLENDLLNDDKIDGKPDTVFINEDQSNNQNVLESNIEITVHQPDFTNTVENSKKSLDNNLLRDKATDYSALNVDEKNSNNATSTNSESATNNLIQPVSPNKVVEVFSQNEIPLSYEQPLKKESFTLPENYRTITLKQNQQLFIEFYGSNWLFLGDEFNSDSLSFIDRELSQTQTIFKIKTIKTGQALLHFVKHDQLVGSQIHDYILVNIDETFGNFEKKVVSQSNVFEQTTNNLQKNVTSSVGSNKPTKQTETKVISFDDSVFVKENPPKTAEEYLNNVQNYINEKLYELAIGELNDFLGNYNETDESLFLYAQVFESKSEMQDIKKAVEIYKELIDRFPTSVYWNQSKQRYIYLNHFYL